MSAALEHDPDLGPAPAEAPPVEPKPEAGSNLPPAPKQRLAPKLGLSGMVAYVVGLRQQGRMSDGKDAKEAWVLLEPEDLEKLDDIADTLEFFRLERAKSRFAGSRR